MRLVRFFQKVRIFVLGMVVGAFIHAFYSNNIYSKINKGIRTVDKKITAMTDKF